MMNDEPTNGPQARGSAQALAVLHALNEWNCPALRSEICALARLSEKDAMLALRGLRKRGLVVCDGRGTGAKWWLARWPRVTSRAAA